MYYCTIIVLISAELRQMQKERSVIKCTLTLCATYFIAHFVTVAYNVVYMFKVDNGVFRTMSGALFAYSLVSSVDMELVKLRVEVELNRKL